MPKLFQSVIVLLASCLFCSFSCAQSSAVILQYHHISTSTPPSTSISPADFQAHMRYLVEQRFVILPLVELLDALQAGKTLPDRVAALTFDDGYRSVYEEAFPLMQQYNWPFTIFVTPGLVGSNPGLYAGWDQLRQMAAAGASLANHTMNHPYLLDRSPYPDKESWLKQITAEIESAEQRILQESGQSHHILAYPYGEFDPEIQALVSRLGYRALAQNSGAISAASDFTALARYPFSGIYASLGSYAVKASSLAFKVEILSPASPVTTEQAPEVVLDFGGVYRLDQLTCYHNNQLMEVLVEDPQNQHYRLRPVTGSSSRRFHYNCTAPGQDGRYYWYSVPWFNPRIPE